MGVDGSALQASTVSTNTTDRKRGISCEDHIGMQDDLDLSVILP